MDEGASRHALIVAGMAVSDPVGHGPTSTLRTCRCSAARGAAGKQSSAMFSGRRGPPALSAMSAASVVALRLQASRLCTDEQPCASAADPPSSTVNRVSL